MDNDVFVECNIITKYILIYDILKLMGICFKTKEYKNLSDTDKKNKTKNIRLQLGT